MKTNTHWHIILDNITSLFQAGLYSHRLYTIIQDEASKGRRFNLFLECGSCATSLYFAIDRISHNHLKSGADSQPMACPNCGASDGHHYKGIQ